MEPVKSPNRCQDLSDLKNVSPGWGCCVCSTYNGNQRTECKWCDHKRCDLTSLIK